MTEAQLLEIFPEAREVFLKNLREHEKFLMRQISEENRFYEKAVANSDLDYRDRWLLELLEEYHKNNIEELNRKLRRIRYQTAAYSEQIKIASKELPPELSGMREVVTENEPVTDAMVERARWVPLELLLPEPPKRKVGRGYKLRCPLHSERTPSFVVYEKENRFHCFGCGAGGDAIDFIMRMEELSFLEAVRKLCRL